MYVKDYENFNNQESCVTKAIGNATLDTEITFEFALKQSKKTLFCLICIQFYFIKGFDENNIKEVPFQLQIVYNAKDGSKALRIVTQNKPLTSDKTLAEAGLLIFFLVANQILLF